MTVEAVIFDVSGTLVREATGQAQPGIADALVRLRDEGLLLIAVSNQPRSFVTHRLSTAGLLPVFHYIMTADVVKAKKGSPRWIAELRHLTGLQPHQFFYVGDEHHDMITATRGPIIYTHAQWSKPPGKYGLVAPAPGWVPAVVLLCFRKRHRWYWSFDGKDERDRKVNVAALVDAGSSGLLPPSLRAALLNLFKSDVDSPVGSMSLREFVMLHMLGSLYDENVLGDIDFWTTYPGHSGDPNTVMGQFLEVAALLFRDHYHDDLLSRHTAAKHSLRAWNEGGAQGALKNQTDTMCLGAAFRNKLAGRRVLLIDNFLTRGYTVEVGRNLLQAAGTTEVVVRCVGKYPGGIHLLTAPSTPWDPFGTNPPRAASWSVMEKRGNVNRAALEEFIESYKRMCVERW